MDRRHLTSAVAALLAVPLLAAPVLAAPVTAAQPAAAEPAGRTIGTWSVSPAGPDTWQVAWTSPEPLSVGGDHPRIITSAATAGLPAGTDLGTTSLSGDGRTVGVTVVTKSRPRRTALDVVLSGRTLDEPDPGSTRRAPGSARFTPPERELLPVDPGAPGDVPFSSRDYTLDPIQVDGMPVPVEMVGHVVAPTTAEADDPLVLILHGRHFTCFIGDRFPSENWPCKGKEQVIPNHLGYEYLQEHLAGQGFATVSISANAITAQDSSIEKVHDFGAAARAQLVQAHLDQWAAWDAAGEETVDLDNVVLVGHSRGGEGVARASLEIPLDAPYQVTGQVLIAPTDFAHQTSPYVPTVTLLPYCDGDVSWLGGQSYTDRSRDLITDDTSIKSSVLVMGANHNYFNTEWTPGLASAFAEDDFREPGAGSCEVGSSTRLTASEQRDVSTAYVAGAVRLFAEGEEELLPMFDGSATRVASTGDAVVLSHMLGGGRTVRRPGIDATPTTSTTATVRLCDGATPMRKRGAKCGRYAHEYRLTPHWPEVIESTPTAKALEMSWTEAGAVGGLDLTEPLDLGGTAALDLRTIVDPLVGDVELEVRVTDATGSSDQVAAVTGTLLSALPRQAESGGRYWAQTLRVDPAELDGVDLEQVSRIELVGLSEAGRVWLLDASAVPDGLPPVPAKRMPLVDLGSVAVKEGPAGTQVAEVPFDVVGELETDASFRVYEENPPVNESPGSPTGISHLVEVPAGSTGGTFQVEYDGNDVDSVSPRLVLMVGHGLREVLVRDYLGELAVLDDDPSPRLRFSVRDDVVDEGDTTTWVIRLKGSSKSGLLVGLRPVPGDGSAVTASDVPRSWLREVVYVPPGTDPALHETNMTLFDFVADFQPVAVFEVPIRDDDVKEGAETLTFRAVTNTGFKSRPLTVTIPAGR